MYNKIKSWFQDLFIVRIFNVFDIFDGHAADINILIKRINEQSELINRFLELIKTEKRLRIKGDRKSEFLISSAGIHERLDTFQELFSKLSPLVKRHDMVFTQFNTEFNAYKANMDYINSIRDSIEKVHKDFMKKLKSEFEYQLNDAEEKIGRMHNFRESDMAIMRLADLEKRITLMEISHNGSGEKTYGSIIAN